MLEKISLIRILRDHLATLYRADTGRRSKGDLLLFFGMPLGVTLALWAFRVVLKDGLADTVITSLSILAGLLFNLLLLLFGLTEKIDFGAVDSKDLAGIRRVELRFQALREAYANASFSVVAALAAIVLLAGVKAGNSLVKILLSAPAIGTSTLFLLTLLMILNRVQVLFNNEVRSKVPPRPERPEVRRLVDR